MTQMTDKQRNIAKRAHRILEIATAMAGKIPGWSVRSQVEEIRLNHNGYAEPGYTDPECGIVATGNWNTVTKWNDQSKSHDLISDLPKRIGDLFEKMGIPCEWGDEWLECGNCYKLIRTSPDSYSWQPDYAIGEGDITCGECLAEDPSDYLESLEGESGHCVALERINPAEHGYVKVNDDSYESGWHPGQTDDPKKVAEHLRAKGIDRFLFKLDENSQFYSRWSVYVHESEANLLKVPVCPKCKSTDVTDCNEGECDRQEGKPLANHCGKCGHTWTKEESSDGETKQTAEEESTDND